jgi:hypothetical protein
MSLASESEVGIPIALPPPLLPLRSCELSHQLDCGRHIEFLANLRRSMISVGFPAVQLPTGYINMQTPQQEDAVSCGVSVLQTIRSLIKAIPPSSVEAIEHIQGWGQRKTLALTIISTMRLIVQSIQQQYEAVEKSTSFTVRSNAKKRTSSRFAALL